MAVGIYEVVIDQSCPAGDIKNVLHYEFINPGAAVFQDFVDHLAARFVANCQVNFTPSYSLLGATFRETEPGAVGVSYTITGGAVNGTAPETEFASQVAMLINKFNDDGTRPARGRMYIGGLTADALNSESLWKSSVRDTVVQWWEDMNTGTLPVTGEALDMRIAATDPTQPNTEAFPTVDRLTGNVNPGTQRRRRRGVGS